MRQSEDLTEKGENFGVFRSGMDLIPTEVLVAGGPVEESGLFILVVAFDSHTAVMNLMDRKVLLGELDQPVITSGTYGICNEIEAVAR